MNSIMILHNLFISRSRRLRFIAIREGRDEVITDDLIKAQEENLDAENEILERWKNIWN